GPSADDGAGARPAGANDFGLRGRATERSGGSRRAGDPPDRGTMARPLREHAAGRAARRAAPWRPATDYRRPRWAGSALDVGDEARGRHALEHARDGEAQRVKPERDQ